MATGVLLEMQGVGEEDYDRLIELLRLDQNPPLGGIFHSAGPIPNGWRVFNIWDSRDLYEQFYEDRVIPGLKQLGMSEPTRKEYFPIHNVYVAQPTALSALNIRRVLTSAR